MYGVFGGRIMGLFAAPESQSARFKSRFQVRADGTFVVDWQSSNVRPRDAVECASRMPAPFNASPDDPAVALRSEPPTATMSRGAVGVFICGVASLLVWPLSVPGAIYGSRALKQIRKSGGALKGRRLALVGTIAAWLSLVGWPCLVVLGGTMMPSASVRTSAEITAAQAQMAMIRMKLKEHKEAHGAYPAALADLKPSQPAPNGRSWDPARIRDPWDQPFHYRFPSHRDPNGYDLSSSGPDLVLGSDDDVTLD
jgi:hypothetical protein